ncbi:MAG: hypothetical protein ACRDY1_11410, partial [Acidimicrobiales bacterium]
MPTGAPVPVELRALASPPGGYEAWGHGRRIGTVAVESHGRQAAVRAVLDRAPAASGDTTALVIAAVGAAKREG